VTQLNTLSSSEVHTTFTQSNTHASETCVTAVIMEFILAFAYI